VVPEELWQLGEELGWSVELVWPTSGEAGTLDAILRRHSRSTKPVDEAPTQQLEVLLLRPTIASEKEPGWVDWEDFGNRPQSAAGVDLLPELRRSLRTSLPDFMVPAEFVLLDSIPLSSNGKVDRRALPPPVASRVDLGAEYQAPISPLERVVAGIWSDVLEVHPMGTLDDFYELGGHSLSATRIVSRVNDTFSMEVPLAAFFEHPNVTAFAELVQGLARQAGIDVDSVAEVILEVDRLSDDEVDRALAEADDMQTEAETP
jgi:acyl carrier protein